MATEVLTGPTKVMLAEYLARLTTSELGRLALRAGLPSQELARLSGGKVDQALGMLRLVERLSLPREDARGIVGQLLTLAGREYGLRDRDPGAFATVAEALAREGIQARLDHPALAVADAAQELAEGLGLEKPRELAMKALRRFSSDPPGAVTAATTFAESVCREALRSVGINDAERDQLPELLVRLRKETNLESLFGGTAGKPLLRALSSLAESAYQLAHDVGDRHPGLDDDPGDELRWFQVGAAMTLGHGILEVMRLGRLGVRVHGGE